MKGEEVVNEQIFPKMRTQTSVSALKEQMMLIPNELMIAEGV